MPENVQGRRPEFLDELSRAYTDRGKSVILLTGNTRDWFWTESVRTDAGTHSGFLPLEQRLYQELHDKLLVVRMDAAAGISLYDPADRDELLRVSALADATANEHQKLGNVAALVDRCFDEPLPALVLLKRISEGFQRARLAKGGNVKPLCVIFQYAGSLFPCGEWTRLSELDRQRLVTFLSWITAPKFTASSDLVILIADTRAEISAKILAEPATEQIEAALPDIEDRRLFAAHFVARKAGVTFDMGADGQEDFVIATAGLKLTNVEDILEVGLRSRTPVTRKAVVDEVNVMLKADLGEIIQVLVPDHGTKDIVGHENTGAIFREAFLQCDNPDTAVSAILVSGPNGGGKTFQLQAYAAESGRVVIMLAGLRSMWFGETDRLFERLYLYIHRYGKLIILVDEAHTAFGSVHSSNTHETEKRLAGNIIQMQGDATLLGKVVWGLMTARPDELDPDVKSRAPLQIPIFDLEGDARGVFVRELFARRGVRLADPELRTVLDRTELYSSRDYNFLVRQVLAKRKPVAEVLNVWQASSSIVAQRRFQSLLAAQHCSYPQLTPDWIKRLGPEEIQAEVEKLRWSLQK